MCHLTLPWQRGRSSQPAANRVRLVSQEPDAVHRANHGKRTRHAADHGIPVVDGVGLLVHQALLSLRRWLPDAAQSDSLLVGMRQAAEAALAEG